MKMSFKITRKILILKTQNTKMIWGNGMTNNFGEGSKSKKKNLLSWQNIHPFILFPFFLSMRTFQLSQITVLLISIVS